MRIISSSAVICLALVPLLVAGCANRYSPDNYSSSAVQQVARVDRAVIQNVRVVTVEEANLALGGATGGAAGAIAGSAVGHGGGNALAVLGGAVAGVAIGAVIEHEATKTQAYEYIVQKTNGDLLSVVQRDATPLLTGQKVMVIYGVQARIIPEGAPIPAPAPAS